MQVGVGDTAYVIDARKIDVRRLMPYIESPNWLKVIQNAKFEQRFSQNKFEKTANNVFDTYLAQRLIAPNSYAQSLVFLAAEYLGKTLEKETRKSFINFKGEISTEQIEYAAEDVKVLQPIMDEQLKKLKSDGMEKVASLEFELAGVVASMENVGVPVDRPRWQQLIEETRVKHEKSRLLMHEILFDDNDLQEQTALFVRDSIDLNSPKQVIAAFKKIGIKIPKIKDKLGREHESTDERVLALIDHPAARELLEYRGIKKILDSYNETFLDKIHPFDNRIHADWQQVGTETGRFACKDPNLQQMPENFRECISSPDHVVISADYSNIELRILAELSKDPALMKAFASGDDPHKATASIMFNVPLESVSKDQRYIAKTINFGISYGMGTGKLMDMLNHGKSTSQRLTFTDVNNLHKKYKSTYSKAMNWLEEAGRSGFHNGYSTTIMGRRRLFRRPDSSALEPKEYERQLGGLLRQAANSPIQGSNADITKLAMLRLNERLKDEGWRGNIMIQVHDEVVLLAHKRQADEIKSIVAETMIEAAKELVKNVPIKVDVHVADKWMK